MLDKQAARAGLKTLRGFIEAGGSLREAEELAARYARAGAIKTTGPGSQIRHLGSGSEAVATLVAGGRDAGGGLSVRKAYDPRGPLASKDMLAAKFNMQRRLNDSPLYAKLLSGRIGRGRRGVRYTHHEMVSGHPYSAEGVMATELEHPMRGSRSAVGNRLSLTDVGYNADNVRAVGPGSRDLKVIDFLPWNSPPLKDERHLRETLDHAAARLADAKRRPLRYAASRYKTQKHQYHAWYDQMGGGFPYLNIDDMRYGVRKIQRDRTLRGL